MKVEIVKLPECFQCNQSIDFRDEVELILDEPQHDAAIVNGEVKLVLITARYFCSEAHANDYKKWLANHKREVSNGSLHTLR